LRERRELGGANQWRDVEIEVLPVVDQGGAIHAGSFPARETQLAGFGDGDAVAAGGVDSAADVDRDLGVVDVGISLRAEVFRCRWPSPDISHY
jgi:hypothetical protein